MLMRCSCVLLTTFCLAGVLPIQAEQPRKEGLSEIIAQLAQSVRKVAGKLDQPAVRIGHFSPFGLDDSNAGGAFGAALDIALKNFVNPAAALELRGEYGFIEKPEKSGLKVIVLRAKLIRVGTGRDEKEFPEFEAAIRSVTDLARLLGGIVAFPPDDQFEGIPPSEGRNKILQKTLPPGPGKPPALQAHIHGPGDTLVSATKDSLYAVEIRTLPLAQFGKEKSAPRKVEMVNGLPFAPIEKGELYEVRVLNSSNHEIAVSLALDGIDQFTFTDDRTDGRPNYSHWIVAPKGDVLIRGWHKTARPLTDEDKRQGKGNVLKFLVTNYGEGAASKFPTRAQGKVGTITVGIALSFPPGSGHKGASETGFGPPEPVKQTVVKRDIAAPHEFVTVRYNR